MRMRWDYGVHGVIRREQAERDRKDALRGLDELLHVALDRIGKLPECDRARYAAVAKAIADYLASDRRLAA